MSRSLALRPRGVRRCDIAERLVKAGEHRSPVLAGSVDCPTNLVFNDLFEIALIPDGCITAAKKVKSPIVLASIQQELSIVAEDTGLVGVYFDGTFVVGLGGIVVAANSFEEAGVVAEDSGVVGVGVDGAFVEFFERYPAALAALSELRLVPGRNTNRIEHDLQVFFILLFRQVVYLIPT